MLAVARWLHDESRWIEKSDRAIPWRRLQQILAYYACEFEAAAGGTEGLPPIRTTARVSVRHNQAERPGACAVKKKRFSVEQITAVLQQAEHGVPVGDLCRKVGISEQSLLSMEEAVRRAATE